MTDRLDISRHGYTFDNITGNAMYCDEVVTVQDGFTMREIRDPLGIIQGVEHASNDRAVALWELRAQLAKHAMLTAYRAIPESRRRAEHRRIAHQQRQNRDVCASCGGSGWIDEDDTGCGYECPACR